jgi:hypothetical protein
MEFQTQGNASLFQVQREMQPSRNQPHHANTNTTEVGLYGLWLKDGLGVVVLFCFDGRCLHGKILECLPHLVPAGCGNCSEGPHR